MAYRLMGTPERDIGSEVLKTQKKGYTTGNFSVMDEGYAFGSTNSPSAMGALNLPRQAHVTSLARPVAQAPATPVAGDMAGLTPKPVKPAYDRMNAREKLAYDYYMKQGTDYTRQHADNLIGKYRQAEAQEMESETTRIYGPADRSGRREGGEYGMRRVMAPVEAREAGANERREATDIATGVRQEDQQAFTTEENRLKREAESAIAKGKDATTRETAANRDKTLERMRQKPPTPTELKDISSWKPEQQNAWVEATIYRKGDSGTIVQRGTSSTDGKPVDPFTNAEAAALAKLGKLQKGAWFEQNGELVQFRTPKSGK